MLADHLRRHPMLIFIRTMRLAIYRGRLDDKWIELGTLWPLPRYSPDLNIIEHVWDWMKDWIQESCLNELPEAEQLYQYTGACVGLDEGLDSREPSNRIP